MAVAAADELLLLERVFLRIGSAETDEQLQNAVSKFLPPVLLKLSSTQDGVRKKVMELLVHINKRIKSRPMVQLPVEALLVQYQDPAASSFVTNFTIIYLKMGFPRLSFDKQTELVPTMLNSLEGKPQSHQDSLLLMIIPLLGHVAMPSDPSKRNLLFGLNEKPHVAKHLCGMMLDMLLLPYGATSSDANKSTSPDSKFPVPPGMCEYSYKRVTADNPLKPEELEQVKLGIVKFISYGVFPDADILIHLIVAAADSRFSVANSADRELKKIVGGLDWGSTALTTPLYMLFLGSQPNSNNVVKPEMKKLPASTRIRLKILHYLCRVTADGFIVPPSIQIIFDSLYGTSTNQRLKTLALTFALNLIREVDAVKLARVTFVLLAGLQKFLPESDPVHHSQVFILLGQMGRRFPVLFQKDVNCLEGFLDKLAMASPELRLSIRECLLNIAHCYKITEPEYTNVALDLKHIEKTIRDPEKVKSISIELHLIGLISYCLRSAEPIVRFVAVRYAATVFPDNYVSARYLLLLSTGDNKDEVFTESLKALYGTQRIQENEKGNSADETLILPDFIHMCAMISKEAKIRKNDERRYDYGSHVLPFSPTVFTEMLAYLRLCLAKGASLALKRGLTQHPNDSTPQLAKYLRHFATSEKKFDDSHPLKQYLHLIQEFMTASPGAVPISCMLEIIGCIPDLIYKDYVDKLNWFKGYLNSTKEEIRCYASVLYGILIAHSLNNSDFDKTLNELMNTVRTDKNLENQHGSLLAIANALERRITLKKNKHQLQGIDQNWLSFKNSVELLVSYLDNSNVLLITAACTGLGLLGRCYTLPLSNAKTASGNEITKLKLVNKLLEIMNNSKYSSKLREKAAYSLGYICVGEIFPHTREVLVGFIKTAKETKDIEVHFSVGESLVMCVQSIWANEARDPWTITSTDYSPVNSMMESPPDDDLNWLLDELLTLVKQSHPNSRQASCVWLLALLKHCSTRDSIKNKLRALQSAFKDLLGENNDIVQDIASKGLGLVYENSDEDLRKEMLDGLLEQLQSGKRSVTKVTDDTKLFEEGQLGKSPTGGNLTTYKEICSLASDLNKPDLIFKFMNLANHNAIWNSKKGAAFGFSTIASKAGAQIQPHLPKIIPRLYRYQFDPTPNLQSSMHRIWNELVPDKQKAVDKYHKEILSDLIENLTSNQWRVRLSCCLAVQDFMRGSANRSIHDYIDNIAELWKQLFRVMDDYHEETRKAANSTAKVVSKLCINGCDIAQGKNGIELMNAILPVFLQIGITHTVEEIRNISLLTVSKLVTSAGNSLKPFLNTLIPALLQATGDLESRNLSHLSTIYSGRMEVQEAIDSARASAVKTHYTMDTLTKCLQYVDITIMDELVPKVADIMKNSVGLGTKIACGHFIILLTVQLGKELTPYTGRFLALLMNGLTDRNAAVRKQYAIAIGHLVASAKDSSIDKLFTKLQNWYFKLEDENIRSVIAHTIRAIGIQNQEILKSYSNVVLPLVFFAMHAEKTEETKDTIELWRDIWSENSPGTASGIKQNLDAITTIIQTSLESPNWIIKAQAANSIATVAAEIGSTMDSKYGNILINMLVTGLSGRTWNGKEKLLKALASVCKNCKEIKTDSQVNIEQLVDAVMKECNKDEIIYKKHCLEACGDILEALEVDRFDALYKITKNLLSKDINTISNDDSDDEKSVENISKKRENLLKLKETIYEALGKAWPSNVTTQEKYRDLFVEHCVSCLPTTVRNVQVSIVLALQKYVSKLTLLERPVAEMSKNERDNLNKIVNNILQAMKITLDISKHLKLRKESLNVLLTLCKRLKDINANIEMEIVRETLTPCLNDVEKDPQPEIKTRLLELKELIRL